MWLVAQSDINDALKELGIIPLSKPIMEMTMKEIRAHFGNQTNNNVKMGLLMRNLIWQIHSQIQAGNPPDFVNKRGNIRSMWYYIKKKFSKHHALRGDHYGTMSKELAKMVKKGLFSYADFKFRDSDSGNWKLGFSNPHIILVSEKEGFITIMEDLQKLYGCHAITTGGIPSFLTVNYMAAAMKEYDIDFKQTFYIFSFADFDPSGYNVTDTLVEHLSYSGIKNLHLFEQWGTGKKRRPWLDLAVPKNFDNDVEDFKYKLPKSTWDDKTTKEWVKLTGGLDKNWKPGEKTHGIESDEFDLELIQHLFSQALKPHLTTNSGDIQKTHEMKALRQELEQMAFLKFMKSILDS